MFEIDDSVPSFLLEGYMDYCNPQLYLNSEEPTEIFYSFDKVAATEMWYYSLTNEQQELRHSEDEESYNNALERAYDNDIPLSVKSEMISIKYDIVRKDALSQSYNLNVINNDIHQYAKKFFKEIESVANLVFIDVTASKKLSSNNLNIAFADFKNADFGTTEGAILSATILPSKNVTFPGVVVAVQDLSSTHYKSYLLKTVKHQILQGLCEAYPSFDNSKDEIKYRSMVEDFSNSIQWESCLKEFGHSYYIKCAVKFGINPVSVDEDNKNFQLLNRCVESNIDKKCLHLPSKLTPVDVKHLQSTFGISKKEIDDSGFRKKFEKKYPEYIVGTCFSDS